MAHYIFNVFGEAAEHGSALCDRAADMLRSGTWTVGAGERHRDALSPGDLVLIYAGAPARQFVGRARLDAVSDGVVLTEIEEWAPPVPMDEVLSRIDRSAGARADFDTGIVGITQTEYDTAVSVAAEREA